MLVAHTTLLEISCHGSNADVSLKSETITSQNNFIPETACEDLRAPINGATVCDLWSLGNQCQVQCQEGFDFAHDVPDLYVCGTNDGKWKPKSTVPDCSSEYSIGPNKHTQHIHFNSAF